MLPLDSDEVQPEAAVPLSELLPSAEPLPVLLAISGVFRSGEAKAEVEEEAEVEAEVEGEAEVEEEAEVEGEAEVEPLSALVVGGWSTVETDDVALVSGTSGTVVVVSVVWVTLANGVLGAAFVVDCSVTVSSGVDVVVGLVTLL